MLAQPAGSTHHWNSVSRSKVLLPSGSTWTVSRWAELAAGRQFSAETARPRTIWTAALARRSTFGDGGDEIEALDRIASSKNMPRLWAGEA
jgi:hypothetical protein